MSLLYKISEDWSQKEIAVLLSCSKSVMCKSESGFWFRSNTGSSPFLPRFHSSRTVIGLKGLQYFVLSICVSFTTSWWTFFVVQDTYFAVFFQFRQGLPFSLLPPAFAVEVIESVPSVRICLQFSALTAELFNIQCTMGASRVCTCVCLSGQKDCGYRMCINAGAFSCCLLLFDIQLYYQPLIDILNIKWDHVIRALVVFIPLSADKN